MTIELLYFDGCPNHDELLPRLREIVATSDAHHHVELRRIDDDEAALRERFLGSPTVRVDGRDIEPGADGRTDFGMKCRLYRTARGLSGQPDEQLIRGALRTAEGADEPRARILDSEAR